MLVGCEVPHRYLRLTVVNNTSEALGLRIGPTSNASVRANTTVEAEIGANASCYSDVNVITEDGTLWAENPGTVCDGDTWVIEPADLVPVDDADKTPAPSS